MLLLSYIIDPARVEKLREVIDVGSRCAISRSSRHAMRNSKLGTPRLISCPTGSDVLAKTKGVADTHRCSG